MHILDKEIRIKALDPTDSFIVQAPAGSGKTEILTQRFLKLLSTAQTAPEEILAVTFTRKAAAQMRARIMQALEKASLSEPETDHERQSWILANEVLKRNEALGWGLKQNPNRLRIVTIDALCTYIVNKMPVLSHIGAMPELANDPQPLYEMAIDLLLKQTTQEEPWEDALKQCLLHVDNRVEKLKKLFMLLLAKRDQWLLYLGHIKQEKSDLTEYFQQSLTRVIQDHIQQLQEQLSLIDTDALLTCLRYAANESQQIGLDNAISRCHDLIHLPSDERKDLPLWEGIIELLLTQKGEWRKKLTEKEGFPSKSKTKDKQEQIKREQHKEMMLAILDQCAENPQLLTVLADTRVLPDPQLTDQQLNILDSLGQILPVLVALLRIVFQTQQKVDFIEISLRALEALGDELAPSDVALFLDHQLRHILIDEYQDTSVIQFRIFEKLISGWQPNDGKTLFLVGDPMQSIYRFRGAEVSLFLKTLQDGLGPIQLTPLQLSMNFRSKPTIVNWVNEHFSRLFPRTIDLFHGGVPYANAQPIPEDRVCGCVHLHPILKDEAGITQVNKIMDLILLARKEDPQSHIAILVRAKKQLYKLIPHLKQLQLPFVAHEVEQLGERPHVLDLLSLLKALQDFTDRVSWLALLRSPLVGLSLADLLALVKHHPDDMLWPSIQQFADIKPLSDDTKARLSRFVLLITHWLKQQKRKPISQWIRGIWLALGGPYAYSREILPDIEKVLSMIEAHYQDGALSSLDTLQEKLLKSYSDISQLPVNGDNTPAIELMTIHKAKGLEFDVVILPALQERPKYRDKELLVWLERTHDEGIDLLLAPHHGHQEGSDPLYQYIEKQHRYKDELEAVRLFYVAATRAKRQLYFIAEVEMDEQNNIKSPQRTSFLHLLWPQFQDKSPDPIPKVSMTVENTLEPFTYRRLPMHWQLPTDLQMMLSKDMQPIEDDGLNRPDEHDMLAQHAGTIFHRIMQQIVNHHPSIDALLNGAEMALKRLGLIGKHNQQALQLIQQGLKNMLADPKGLWILDPSHQERQTEWSISVKTSAGVNNYIIDYAFVDTHNTRWIIDYKLTQGELSEEIERYRHQLQQYRRAISLLENRKIRCGLYFPLTQTWWEYHEETISA